MAVDPQSFGGWRVAWRGLLKAGVDPQRHLKQLRFAGYQNLVPQAVLAGEVDAGTVRSGILERLAHEGKLKLSDLRRPAPQIHDQLPLLALHPPLCRVAHGAPGAHLFPNWPRRWPWRCSRLPADAPASQAAGNAGWTTPESYVAVRDLLRELRLGPYHDLGMITLERCAGALLAPDLALGPALHLHGHLHGPGVALQPPTYGPRTVDPGRDGAAPAGRGGAGSACWSNSPRP